MRPPGVIQQFLGHPWNYPCFASAMGLALGICQVGAARAQKAWQQVRHDGQLLMRYGFSDAVFPIPLPCTESQAWVHRGTTAPTTLGWAAPGTSQAAGHVALVPTKTYRGLGAWHCRSCHLQGKDAEHHYTVSPQVQAAQSPTVSTPGYSPSPPSQEPLLAALFPPPFILCSPCT